MKKANLLSKGILLSILGLGLSACDDNEIFNKKLWALAKNTLFLFGTTKS